MLAFIDGVSKDRIIGFEGLGFSQDTFTAKDLETRLLSVGVLTREKTLGEAGPRTARNREEVEDDDDDWD